MYILFGEVANVTSFFRSGVNPATVESSFPLFRLCILTLLLTELKYSRASYSVFNSYAKNVYEASTLIFLSASKAEYNRESLHDNMIST